MPRHRFIPTVPLGMRFFSKISPEPMSGCWLWTGPLTDKGYGSLPFRQKTLSAHKFSYELYVGRVPDGLELDHKCRNPCCVNPQHLEPVTHAENMRRSRRTHCRKGHPYSGDNLVICAVPNRPNVGGMRICKICSRKWKADYDRKHPRKSHKRKSPK